MKLIKTLFILVILGAIGVIAYIKYNDSFDIPNTLVYQSVKMKFPIEKSYPLGKIKLFNPKVHFENNKLIIESEYINDALNDKIRGTMTFETSLRYDIISAKLYTDNLKIIKLTREEKEIDLSEKPIIRTALQLASSQFEKKEILDLKNFEKFHLIRDIKIENNKIKVIQREN